MPMLTIGEFNEFMSYVSEGSDGEYIGGFYWYKLIDSNGNSFDLRVNHYNKNKRLINIELLSTEILYHQSFSAFLACNKKIFYQS